IALSRSEQRAWVGVERYTDLTIREHEVVKWSALIVNSGRSPALHMTVRTRAKSIERNAEMSFDYTPLIVRSNSVLQPGARDSIPNDGREPLIPAQIDAIKTGLTMMYIYGRIDYDDIFKQPHY